VLPGLAGHDPWKSHDAVGIGIAYQMATSGDPIVPRVADLAWLSDPPFFHWFAATFAWILQFFIEFHAGARIASGAFMLAALWLAHVAARDWSLGEERSTITGSGALLLLLGSLGLMVHAHEAIPALPALAALCGALAVLPHATRKPVPAGVLFGAGLGFAFLSSSWVGPAALGGAVLAAHLACDEWRTRKGCRSSAPPSSLRRSFPRAGRSRSRCAHPSFSAHGGRLPRIPTAASSPTCATSPRPSAGSPGRPGRSRCGRHGCCGAAGATRAYSCPA